MRGNNAACCFWGAVLLTVLLGFLFWPMLRDWIEDEAQRSGRVSELAD